MVQAGVTENPKSPTDLIHLNVQPDDDKILRCHGRIQGEFHIYLPDDALFTVKSVEDALLETLHGGVILSMAKVRESLKRLIARRGRPSLIYLDNAKTFQAAAALLKRAKQDEGFPSELSKHSIKGRFHLSRAPCWGGQFERLIGLFKSSFYKVVGKGLLKFDELTEVVLDVEICMNNRPLSCVTDVVELPVIRPSSFVLQQTNVIPEVEKHHIKDGELRKRGKYLYKIKTQLWNRWQREYLTSLRQRNQVNKSATSHSKEGDIFLIKGDEKNRNMWKIGKLTMLIRGRDGVVRGVKFQCGKISLERPIQLIYPLELQCDVSNHQKKLRVNAKEFRPRPQAAELAEALQSVVVFMLNKFHLIDFISILIAVS
ncbi:uncharacterized protein LOC124435981 [Xenia sp. Carnegie-2017]|uniref:uncharacterized protein LOC124435981 n=1 Tax=Xenia sp. Carnegie-2017 TaxID=2897299 RepID=UPI001F0435D8|nr:uncharacterized protein LOC124435981 [Xenia sp. Carnegie-2017]